MRVNWQNKYIMNTAHGCQNPWPRNVSVGWGNKMQYCKCGNVTYMT